MEGPVTITDGEVITEDGRYIMSMDWYHSQCCDGPSVSSSGLRKIYHESPADFWAFSDLNDYRFPPPESPAFVFGRAAHALILGDEDFNAAFAIVPKIAPPRPTSAQVKARAEGRVSESAQERFDFWDDWEAENGHKELLTEEDLIHIEHIADNLNDSPILPLLLEGDREHSLIWRDQPTGIWIKSRLDVLSATGDLADLKTTHHHERELILRDIRKRGYDMQMGLGTMGLEQVMGVPFDAESYAGRSAILIHAWKKPPYHVIPIELDFDALYWGRIKCRAAIDRMHRCMIEDHWPGPVEGIPLYTAEYEMTQLQELQAAGLLPNRA